MSTQAIDSPASELDRQTHPIGAWISGQVTGWLALLMVIGASIAVYDGLHRKWMTELETFGPSVGLAYVANKAAWIFAATVLPFVILHGRKLRLSIVESLLLWFVLCTVAYTKDFAYLRIPGAPIFITDVILVVALVGWLAWTRLRFPNPRIVLLLAAFLLLGFFGAARGIAQHMPLTDVLRDLSVPVYALFAFPAMRAKRGRMFAEQFCLMIVCGALIATLIGVSWATMQPGMRRYVVVGMYVPIALVLTAIAMAKEQVSLRAGIVPIALLAFGVVLCNARSVYVELAAASAALLLTGLGKRRAKIALAIATIAFCMIALVTTARLRSLEDAKSHGADTGRVPSTVLAQRVDDNTQWRLLLWKEAAHRFLQHPLIGEGYGVPLTFSLERTDTKPHNIYLYVFYKMGVVGGVVFLVLLIAPTVAAWRALQGHAENPAANLLRALFASQLAMFCWGALNPQIETPFLASIFWLNIGLMLATALRIESGEERCSDGAVAYAASGQ